MKKNFLKVAALLIAAMLLVVSCSQEVKAPENDGLVKASLSVGFDRNIEIANRDNKTITYVYSVKPNWNQLDKGAAIQGEKNKEEITGSTISTAVTRKDIGYVTPGLWTVSVEGYVDYNSVSKTGTLVLKGETNVYFNKDNTTATVLVAPVITGDVTVNIDLEMQDLGVNYNEIHLEFDDNNATTANTSVILKSGETGVTVTQLTVSENEESSDLAAYKYVKNGVALKSGFYTVKVSVPGYNGGYVRTFLALAGSTVSISGSVYPSEFISSSMDIITISLASAQLTNTNPVKDDATGTYSITFTLNDDANTYLSNDQITYLTNKSDVESVTVNKTYDWYLNSAEKAISSSDKVFTITGINPGYPSVSCVINYLVTIKYTNGDTETKKFIGHANSNEFTLV